MHGEFLMLASGSLVERLLLASLDALLLGALVALFLRLARRCPPRWTAALWLLVLGKPLLTLAIGPSVSLLAIPIPWEANVAQAEAPLSTANLARDQGPSDSHPLKAQSPGPEESPDLARSVAGDRPNEGPGAIEMMPTVTEPSERDATMNLASTGHAAPPLPLSEGVISTPGQDALQPAIPGPGVVAATPTVPPAERLFAESAPDLWSTSKLLRGGSLLWIAFVVGSLVMAIVRCLALRHRVAGCIAPGQDLVEIYEEVRRELQHRGRPARLVTGDFVRSPALIGCWRPVIVLPTWFANQKDRTQLRWALKHEVVHLLHADHWADLVRRVSRTLLFFHPVVRLAARRWEEAAEAACDLALVQQESDVVDYTACLLSIVEQVGAERMQTEPLGLFATQTQIQQRIERLLALRQRDFTPLQRYRWLLLPIVVMVLCGFSLAQTSPHETAGPEPSPASPATDSVRPSSEQTPESAPKSILETLTSALDDASDSAPPPMKSDLDPATAELLAKALQANRYWFEGPPRRVPAYRYTFVHSYGKRQEFTVADPQSAGAWVKRGITYTPLSGVLLKALAEMETTDIKSIQRTDEEIRIEFETDGSVGARLGGGVSGSWQGYIFYKLGNGTLRLNAKTLLPIELRSTLNDEGRDRETVVTEKLGEPVEVDPGHWVPLRVEAVRHEKETKNGEIADESTSRFEWAFRVYEPGLWLFDAELAADGTAIGYHIEDVVIGEVKTSDARATSAALAAIEASEREATEVVEQYVEANRAWLLPDLAKRRGLVYDYTQEDGYRERITFDRRGNILAELSEDRKSNKTSTAGQQRFYTADGREIFGNVDEPFVTIHSFDPASTSPFSGQKILNNLATGWGWECASMRLARAPKDFAVAVGTPVDEKTWTLRLQPLRNRPNLHIGTMLCFTSWAYLPNHAFRVCKIRVDRETRLPIKEVYYRKGEEEPFCTIQFEDWLDTPEGKAPGKVIGTASYRKRGERDPKTREYAYVTETFEFTGKYRVTEGGFLLLDEATSRFETLDNGSTGRVSLVAATDDDFRPLEEMLSRAEATSEFLAQVEKAPHGLNKTVPCRWGETVPVWLNGKYEHQASGQGAEDREPPYTPYRNNLGIQDLRPEVLDDGKIRVTVRAYSTIYYQGYSFDVTLDLLDGEGRGLAEQTASGSTKTMGRPEQKQVVFDFEDGIEPESVASIRVTLRVKFWWGSHYYRGMWSRNGSDSDRKTSYLPNARDWGPEQAVGEPENRRIGGDYKHAWSSLTEDSQEEWIELIYRKRVRADGVDVYETLNPGAVHKVAYYDNSGQEQVAWEGDDPVTVNNTSGVSKIRFAKPVETNRVRLYLDSPKVKGWNEIDAVGLVGKAGPESPAIVQWAVNAKASSTFAEGPTPETITYLYDGPHFELKYDDGLQDGKQSLGGAWQVIRFNRPQDQPYLDAVQVLATRYGSRPENAGFYILDEAMNILWESTSKTRVRYSGPMRWYSFHAPSVEVPETFHVAFELNSRQQGGIYVATRELTDETQGHSFSYNEGQGLKPLTINGADSDWMIRAYMSDTPDEKARQEDEVNKMRESQKAAIAAKGRGWAPEQATGEPDAYNRPRGGDYPSAWASKTEDNQAEWLELTYPRQIKAIGIDVYETFNPGAVNKVTAFATGGEESIAWEGADPTPAGIAGGKGISKIRFATPVETQRIRLYLDSPKVKGWNEIDAVGLVESETTIHWATSAQASSTYAH